MTTDQLTTGAVVPPYDAHTHRDWPYRRSALKRYGLAVVAVLVACALRYMIYGDLNMRLAFTFFVPAAIVAAWYGGLGPGVVATIGGLAVGITFAMYPRATMMFGGREIMAVTVYTVTTMVCVLLCEHLHYLVRRLEHMLEHERHQPAAAAQTTQPEPAPLAAQHEWLRTPFHRPAFKRYSAALAVVALAFALRYWMFGTQDHRFPFIFFVPAAMVATWYGGMAPGLIAAVAGLMLGDYFFLSAHEALGPVREAERLATGLYAMTTALCVMMIESLHTRIARTEHALEHARHHHHRVHTDTAGSAFPH